MSDLETLKAQYPEWCWEFSPISRSFGSRHEYILYLQVATLVALVQQHEATIAELENKLAAARRHCPDHDHRGPAMAHNCGHCLAEAQATIQQRERELGGAAGDVIAERRRQVQAEGWTPEHDDEHDTGEMAMAASCYAAVAGDPSSDSWYVEMVWPWGESWWKPSDARRNLVKAGALILAEIERLDRHSARAQQESEGEPK